MIAKKYPKNIMLFILTISIFVFIVGAVSLYVQTEISQGTACSCFIPLPLFVPFMSAIGMFIGTLVYSMLKPDTYDKNIETIMKLFDNTERKIIDIIVRNKGQITQSRIVKITEINKVKVFRTIEKLKSKGIIDKEKYGKTNKIKMKEEFMELFQ